MITDRSPPLPLATSAGKKPGCAASNAPPCSLHGIERYQIVLRVMPETARILVDDALQMRQSLLDADQLVDLFLVLHHREARLRVIEDEHHLLGHGVLVDRHRHGAEALGCQHRPIELRPVVADDGDLVAALACRVPRSRRRWPACWPPLRPSSRSARCRIPSRASTAGRRGASRGAARASEMYRRPRCSGVAAGRGSTREHRSDRRCRQRRCRQRKSLPWPNCWFSGLAGRLSRDRNDFKLHHTEVPEDPDKDDLAFDD